MPHAPLLLPLGPLLGQLQLPNVRLDPRTNILLGTVVGILAAAYVIGRALRRRRR